MFSVKPRSGELVVGIVLVVIALYVMAVAWRMPQAAASMPGPGFFPFWAGVFLALSGAAIVGRCLVLAAGDGPREPLRLGGADIAFSVVALCASAFLLERLGFVLTAAPFLFVMLWRLSPLGWWKSVVAGIGGAILADLFFRPFLGLYLPGPPELLEPLFFF